MKIKAIIFDVGGVLFTTDGRALKDALFKKYQASIFLFSDYPKEVSEKYNGKVSTGEYSYKQALKEVIGKKANKEFFEDYHKYYIKYQKIDKKILNLIKKLSKKYKIYCFTNTVDMPLEVNGKSGLFSIFDKVYASCEIGFKKPDKKAFNLVLKDIKVKPNECLFIDNNEDNIKAAKELGMNVILFKDYKQLVNELKIFNY